MKARVSGALVFALALIGSSATSAWSADLGGDCCADLEERIAELEATTARKGNRKVSLSVSGFVAKQLLFWDDGVESNVYITDTGSISIGSHVLFTGEAQISPGWKAGYALNIEFVNADSLLVSQNSGNEVGSALAGGGGSIAVERSYWYLKNDQLGQVSIGLQSSAADNQAILPDGSGTLVIANYVLYDSNAFFLRRTDGTLSGVNYGNLGNCQALNGAGGAVADCDGIETNAVRYDSPTLFGFSASVSWAEDDIWAVSGRYAGELSGFKVSGAIAYNESNDESVAANANARLNGGLDVGALQVGGYIQHIATGLFGYGAYGIEFNDTTAALRGNGQISPDGENWYAKVGIRSSITPLGHTVFFRRVCRGQGSDCGFAV